MVVPNGCSTVLPADDDRPAAAERFTRTRTDPLSTQRQLPPPTVVTPASTSASVIVFSAERHVNIRPIRADPPSVSGWLSFVDASAEHGTVGLRSAHRRSRSLADGDAHPAAPSADIDDLSDINGVLVATGTTGLTRMTSSMAKQRRNGDDDDVLLVAAAWMIANPRSPSTSSIRGESLSAGCPFPHPQSIFLECSGSQQRRTETVGNIDLPTSVGEVAIDRHNRNHLARGNYIAKINQSKDVMSSDRRQTCIPVTFRRFWSGAADKFTRRVP